MKMIDIPEKTVEIMKKCDHWTKNQWMTLMHIIHPMKEFTVTEQQDRPKLFQKQLEFSCTCMNKVFLHFFK